DRPQGPPRHGQDCRGDQQRGATGRAQGALPTWNIAFEHHRLPHGTSLTKRGQEAERVQVEAKPFGRCCAQGRAASRSAPSRSTSVSWPQRPTICTEVGRPSVPKPDGKASAGWPVRLKGYW